jgi:hypothetical protein
MRTPTQNELSLALLRRAGLGRVNLNSEVEMC